MGFGALVAAIQGSVTAPTKSLWVDGTDVLKGPGTPGSLFGVPLDSIEHVENGPPGVSSLKFTIHDPLKVITLSRGQWVLYHNHTTDRPYFRGFVKSWKPSRMGLGRSIAVTCTGVDALPDWLIVPALTIPAGTGARDAVLACAAAAIGPGIPLRAFGTAGNDFGGNQATPVAAFKSPVSGLVFLAADVVITAKTLREAINAVFAACVVLGFESWSGIAASGQFVGVTTVDPWLGLRCYGKTAVPSDYATLTVTDTFAGPVVAEGLEHAVDVGDVPAGVYVVGGDAGGTGMVALGDGLPGPIRILSDSTILGAAAKQAAANMYLTDKGAITARGSFALTDNAVSTNVRPGSALVLTDDETGATGTYAIASITRTFTSLRETWRVTYGRLPPSLPRSMRRLTRAILS